MSEARKRLLEQLETLPVVELSELSESLSSANGLKLLARLMAAAIYRQSLLEHKADPHNQTNDNSKTYQSDIRNDVDNSIPTAAGNTMTSLGASPALGGSRKETRRGRPPTEIRCRIAASSSKPAQGRRA